MRPAKPPKPLDREGLMNYAARSLASRAQSISELRTRLKRRASREEDVNEVLAILQEGKVVDDQQFAGLFANWRKENQSLGKGRVMRDLMARRVPSSIAKEAVEAVFEGSDEIALIEQFLARKYRGKDLGALMKEEKNLASAFRKLRLGGYSAGNSIKVLKRYAAEAELLEDVVEEAEESGS